MWQPCFFPPVIKGFLSGSQCTLAGRFPIDYPLSDQNSHYIFTEHEGVLANKPKEVLSCVSPESTAVFLQIKLQADNIVFRPVCQKLPEGFFPK